MIFLCTAMYNEAYPFIKQFNLRKDTSHQKFQVFKNEEITLIITGVGKLKGAIAVTYLLSNGTMNVSDLLINIGVCGTNNTNIPLGTTFLCNKIIDHETQRAFYPDILFTHPFKEASVETFSTLVKNDNMDFEGDLVDMEASGIYQSSTLFLKAHQIFFIKIVSDYLYTDNISKDSISKSIEDQAIPILSWSHKVESGLLNNKKEFTEKEKEMLNQVVKNLKLSSTMEHQLKQLLKFYWLQYGTVEELLKQYMDIECQSKKEGKKHFEELRQKLI